MQTAARPSFKSSYVCTRCLSKSARRFSTTPRARTSAGPAPPPASGFAKLSHRGLVLVAGQDAPKFLQGLTTNNVDPSRNAPWFSGFLSAQGRVLWDALIYPYAGSADADRTYLIEVDSGEIGSFIKHLKRHKLRSKVTIRDVHDEWRIYAAWSGDGASPVAEAQHGFGATEGALLTADPRLSSFGHRIVLSAKNSHPAAAFPEFYGALSETPVASYTVRRYLHGIAEGQQEIVKESALPMESNMDYLNGIDFRKGCYLGQELTIRTQHTGVIRKRILPIQIYEHAVPSTLSYAATEYEIEPGTDIKAEGGKRPAGKLLAHVGDVGLALCRLENMTDLRVSAEGGTYRDGVQFNIATRNREAAVNAKAFVPEWLRAREQEKTERRAKREDPAVE